MEGLEPPRLCGHEDLNLARLPVPPHPPDAPPGQTAARTRCGLYGPPRDGRYASEPRRRRRAPQPGEGLEQGDQVGRDPAPARLGGARRDRHHRWMGRARGREARADRLHRDLPGDGLLRRALEPRRPAGHRGAGDHPRDLRRGRDAGVVRPRRRTGSPARRSTRTSWARSPRSSSPRRPSSSRSPCAASRRRGTSRSSDGSTAPRRPRSPGLRGRPRPPGDDLECPGWDSNPH